MFGQSSCWYYTSPPISSLWNVFSVNISWCFPLKTFENAFLIGWSSEGLIQPEPGVAPSEFVEFPWHQHCSNVGMTQALNFLDFATRYLEPAFQKLLLIASGDPHLLSKIQSSSSHTLEQHTCIHVSSLIMHQLHGRILNQICWSFCFTDLTKTFCLFWYHFHSWHDWFIWWLIYLTPARDMLPTLQQRAPLDRVYIVSVHSY